MNFTVFETNANGTEKYSRAETIEADSSHKAADWYREQFRLSTQATHLMVTSEGGAQKLIALHVGTTSVSGDSSTSASATQGSSSPVVEERCGWSTFCTVIGSLNLLLALIGLLMMGGSSYEQANGFVLVVSGLAGGLSSFIFGYIIQLLFDCRRYLRRLVEK